MLGGRQHNQKSLATSHHHHNRRHHAKAPPRSATRTPDHRVAERIRARHEIWVTRKHLQLKKEEEAKNETLEASPLASLLAPENPPEYAPMRLEWPDDLRRRLLQPVIPLREYVSMQMYASQLEDIVQMRIASRYRWWGDLNYVDEL